MDSGEAERADSASTGGAVPSVGEAAPKVTAEADLPLEHRVDEGLKGIGVERGILAPGIVAWRKFMGNDEVWLTSAEILIGLYQDRKARLVPQNGMLVLEPTP